MLALLLLATLPAPEAPPRQPTAPTTVTILYDAFGGHAGLLQDWGFAALIEYQGKRILFDTGNNAAIFSENVRRLHVDLSRLDFVVVSHRHSDHAAGLQAVLTANPDVTVYAPREPFGIFGSDIPGTFYRPDPALPDSMRYLNGAVPGVIHAGTLWPGAHMIVVDSSRVIAPGIRLVSLVSETPGTLELRELSLVLTTPTGSIVVVGCSHPGIERILAAATAEGEPVRALVGGLHLVATPDSVLLPLAHRLRSEWQITTIAPGHCTGEPAFAALQAAFGHDYVYAGLGERIALP